MWELVSQTWTQNSHANARPLLSKQVTDMLGRDVVGVGRDHIRCVVWACACVLGGSVLSSFSHCARSIPRPAEYRVGETEYMRMKFDVQGSLGKGTVQLEMQKNKVVRTGCWRE